MHPHLYKRPCPSVGRSVCPSVRWLVMLSSKSLRNGLLRILNDTDSAGGGKRNEEEGVTRRKEGRGGMWDEEEGGTEEGVTRRVKNEKVAKGRIIGLAGPGFVVCFVVLFLLFGGRGGVSPTVGVRCYDPEAKKRLSHHI